jgi:hypothetical protein
MKNGTAAKSMSRTFNTLARSLPNTSSLFDKCVSSSSTSVRRSFSWATALAVNSAPKNSANVSCSTARI